MALRDPQLHRAVRRVAELLPPTLQDLLRYSTEADGPPPTCSACGAAAARNVRYCGECGRRVGTDGERDDTAVGE